MEGAGRLARKTSAHLTDAELRLMEVLWEKRSATVAEVAQSLPNRPPLAYSTVLTTLRILERKGHIRHTKDGRAFIYHPVIGREAARQGAVSHLLTRFFQGSPELLVLNLIKENQIDAAELARLHRRIEESDK
jgi:predicted transcriptional regulator